jgi:hypothetical protein
MRIVTLHELIAAHGTLMRSDDPPVQLVVHPDNIAPLLEESGDEVPFEGDGTGGYLFFGQPVFLDYECPGAVVMNSYRADLWKKQWDARMPFGSLSLR